MRIYSDVITEADIHRLLPANVFAEVTTIRRPRVRRHGYVVYLAYFGPDVTVEHGRERAPGRRLVNSGEHGAGYHLGATWDEHGVWMAALFELDANARIAWYDGRADFYTKTRQYQQRGSSAPWLQAAAERQS